MNFTEQEFRMFQKDLREATAELCEKYKIKLKESKIAYSAAEFEMKLIFQKDEEGLDADEIKFSMECFRYGFKPCDYMRSFEHLGTMYRFVGFDTKARKYNCIIRAVETGISSRVNHQTLAEMLKRDEARLEAQEKEKESPQNISKEEMAILQIKLGKNKHNGKDLEQINDIFSGKMVYTFKPNRSSSLVGLHKMIARENEMLSIFTSIETCTQHINELGRAGIISGDMSVVGVDYDNVIAIAKHDRMNVMIDNQKDANKNYFVYSYKNNRIEVSTKGNL